MARKVDASKFGSGAPKLLPEDLEEDAAILTIAEYDEAEVDDDDAEGGKRTAAYLTFEETGDKRIWLNKGQMESLIEQLGDDADKWIGQKVPVEKHDAKYRGQTFPKVRVMLAEDWDAAFKEAGVKRRPAEKATSGKRR